MRVETIGDATLYLGDCRDILGGVPGGCSFVFDPPYGMAYKSGYATDDLWGADRREIDGDADTRADARAHAEAKYGYYRRSDLREMGWKMPVPVRVSILLAKGVAE